MNKLVKSALINASITAAYIVAIATFMNWVSSVRMKDTWVTPIAVLSLFVFSAGFTAFWMLGKPVQMYIDGKKKEAISLLSYTFGFFFVFTLAALALLLFLPR